RTACRALPAEQRERRERGRGDRGAVHHDFPRYSTAAVRRWPPRFAARRIPMPRPTRRTAFAAGNGFPNPGLPRLYIIGLRTQSHY
ncbi:hypothetical protein, partial [Burkholderia pseudomallei]|uniref:hypothetical protein n=1 Tax=Burkholderia pseudomallei TaxID=28450 RepID=UPI001C4BA0FB